MRTTNTSTGGGVSRRAGRSKSADDAAAAAAAGTVATLKQQAAEKVAELAGEVRGRGESFLAQQRARAASELGDIGRSIRDSAASLPQGPLADVSGYVEAAADGLDRASRYLAGRDWTPLRRGAEGGGEG